MVVVNVSLQDSAQVVFVEDNDVIRTFSTNGTDDTFNVWILPRRARCRQHLFDSESPDGTDQVVSIDAVAIPNRVARGGVPGESLAELLSCPRSSRMLGDVEVQDASSVMEEDDDHEQDTESDRRHGEEVDGDEVLDVVTEEGLPGGTGWLPMTDHVLGHGRLGNFDAELDQLAIRGTPQSGLARDMRRMRSWTSRGTAGRPPLRRLFHAQ